MTVFDLGHRITLIDGYELNIAGRTGAYLIQDEQMTLVETGASPCVPHILKAFNDMGIDPKDLRYIILTHIHLDHAGGVGLLLHSCPNAKVVVHPKGARHLTHPERLIEGARAVFGESFDQLYDPILPVPFEAILKKGDGDTLEIGPGRQLKFLDTPGHANHHLGIYDPVSKGMFTGDTLGVYFHQVRSLGVPLFMPVTSPNQFDPEATLQSMERIREFEVERIYFGHFGMSEETEEVYKQISHWLSEFVRLAEETVAEGAGENVLDARLNGLMESYLTERGVAADHAVYYLMRIDLRVAAMGLIHYLSKKQQQA